MVSSVATSTANRKHLTDKEKIPARKIFFLPHMGDLSPQYFELCIITAWATTMHSPESKIPFCGSLAGDIVCITRGSTVVLDK
mmetsp:Transcript_19413/g.28462  ORF Transcript_19413/g.28462 Transcript_19413/m.28462 type:complete len:83 (+) Transcript_19413:885-1133(+)